MYPSSTPRAPQLIFLVVGPSKKIEELSEPPLKPPMQKKTQYKTSSWTSWESKQIYVEAQPYESYLLLLKMEKEKKEKSQKSSGSQGNAETLPW